MESVLLDAPDGIAARLGWDPRTTEHDRRRILAREVLSAWLKVEPGHIGIEREAPTVFGHHTQLVASVDGRHVPLEIRTTSFRAATVVTVSEPGMRVGVDLRDLHPDEQTLAEMRRHSRMWTGVSDTDRLDHWAHVQAVRAADGRGQRLRPEYVVLDAGRKRGWVPDRPERYTIADLSHGGFVVTLAYAPEVP